MRQPACAVAMLFAAASLLGACHRAVQHIPDAVADAALGRPALPALRYARATRDAVVGLTLPRAVEAYPELQAKLYDDGQRELDEFVAQAAEDRRHFRSKGVAQPKPYERRIVWAITAVAPHLISLRQAWSGYTGDVHPAHGSDVLLWDRVRNEIVLPSQLFRPDADAARLDALLCQAVRRAIAAHPRPDNLLPSHCPAWADSRAVLAPSAQAYRIGGLMFLFDPSVIGAYAQGDYQVLIPQTAFRDALAPGWAVDFAGDPAQARAGS